MVDDMIRKNPDSTAADFAEAVKEIEGIEMFACEPMPAIENLRSIKEIVFKPEYSLLK